MDRCDTGCRRRPVTWWESERDLTGWAFCSPCTDRHRDVLDAGGYELWLDARQAEAAQ